MDLYFPPPYRAYLSLRDLTLPYLALESGPVPVQVHGHGTGTWDMVSRA